MKRSALRIAASAIIAVPQLGTLALAIPPETGTNITWTVSRNQITVRWPEDYIGWSLLVQTNHLLSAVSTNAADWGIYPGSLTTNRVDITIDPAKPMEFLRMQNTLSRAGANIFPPMGTLSWYTAGEATATYNFLTNQMASAEANGWLSWGFNLIIIDDGWQGGRSAGTIYDAVEKWPVSLSNAVREAHSRGFKVGIYTEPTLRTSAGFTGSLGYINNDANWFASLGIDYIKFDVYASTNREYHVRQMSQALDAANWKGHLHVGLGTYAYEPWVGRYAESWRCSVSGFVDVTATNSTEAKTFVMRNLDQMTKNPEGSGPGRSVTLDSLPLWVGVTDPEALKMDLAMWAQCNGGLIVHSFRDHTDANWATYSPLLFNRTLIDILQDPSGIMGRVCQASNVSALYGGNGGWQVWRKPLGSANGPAFAFSVLNRDSNAPVTISLGWTNCGFAAGEPVMWEDVLNKTNYTGTAHTVTLPALSGLLFRATRASDMPPSSP